MNSSFVEYQELQKIINTEEGLIHVELSSNQSMKEWLNNNKFPVYTRTLDALERLLTEVDTDVVYIIYFKFKPTLLNPKYKHTLVSITLDEAINDLDNILQWAIENEEYEMCHRIKQIENRL